MSYDEAWNLWFAWLRDVYDEDRQAGQRMAVHYLCSIPEVRALLRERERLA